MMNLVRRLRRLGWADRRIVAHAALLHLAIAVMVHVAPIGWVLRALDLLYASRAPVEGPSEERIVWAVRAATMRIPAGRTCLTIAMTTHYLLKRSGCPTTIRFGVSPVAGRGLRLTAHAWVEHGERIVVGGEDRERYLALE